jgi:hypothetical protein
LVSQTYKSVAEKLCFELNEKKKELEESEKVKEQLFELDNSFEEAKNQLEYQKRNLKRTVSRENYWREKCSKLEEKIENVENIDVCGNENISAQLELMTSKNVKYQEEIQNLKSEIHILHNEIDRLTNLQNDTVFLYNEDKNEYISELHACVYTLLNNHVATEHVSCVIESVLKLVDKKANKLPSKSTIKNWALERSFLARKQISELSGNENLTLYSDESSKYGQKWGSFASRDSDGNYLLLGLRDMATKSSQDTLDTFKEIISDIDAASENEQAGKEILVNIKNTMSDKAGTEKKFNDILREYRDEVLPEVIENFNILNIESQMAISHMNNFFCGLHSLVHMAETAQKAIYEVENAHFQSDIPIQNKLFLKPGQSGTVRLLFTACKAFARRGDQKNGCHGNFLTFVKPFLIEMGFLSLPLQPLKGNRFNILFVNAGHIFFFKEQLLEFLKNTPNLNSLLQSVLHDLQQDFFIAGLKALGLISKLITTPLWHVIESKDISISDMAKRYLDLKLFLDNSVNNIEDIISGEAILYPDVQVKKDKVFERLIQPDDRLDDHTVTILSVLLPALSKLVQHEFGDHLPGGVHENVDEEVTKSTDKHNKYPERVFAYVDYLLAQKPNISSLALESQITFSLNKTDKWLASKTPEETQQLILESRKEVKKERERFKIREQSIREKRLENQRVQFEMKARQERKRIERLEKDTLDMQFYGLWQSMEQISSELQLIKSDKEKVEALKAQLRFRKHVFEQKADSSVYAFSKVVDGKRVNLSVDQLKANVMKLVREAFDIHTSNHDVSGSLLVGKRVKQKFFDTSGNAFWSLGKVISQVILLSLKYNYYIL